MSLNDLLVDSILGPFRLIWEIAPPEYAIPAIALIVILYAVVMSKLVGSVEDSVNHEPTCVGGYNPESGYKYSPEDFDTSE